MLDVWCKEKKAKPSTQQILGKLTSYEQRAFADMVPQGSWKNSTSDFIVTSS